MPKKYVYSFAEGNKDMIELLGLKGAMLSELESLNISVPKGFIISTEACKLYFDNNQSMPEELVSEIEVYLNNLEEVTGKRLGCADNPLFLAVRSSGASLMPGLQSAILNVGISDSTVKWVSDTYSERTSLEIYLNFLIPYMYSILDDDKAHEFEAINHDIIWSYFNSDGGCFKDISIDDIKEFIQESKKLYLNAFNRVFSDEPRQHLFECIKNTFNSWYSPRAKAYRRLNDKKDSQNAAVIVQVMALGNINSNSEVGYYYTRDPKTGENEGFVKVLEQSQNDIYPSFYDIYDQEDYKHKLTSACLQQLTSIGRKIEKHFKAAQEIHFVIEDNVPYIIMSKNAKKLMEAEAELNIAVDMVNEGTISKRDAVSRISKFKFREIALHVFDKNGLSNDSVIAEGFCGCKGMTCGKAYFTEEKVLEHIKLGEKIILITACGCNLDMIQPVEGIITRRGMASNEAIWAREYEKPCVVLRRNLMEIVEEGILLNGYLVKEGDLISIDGTDGRVYKGIQKIIPREREGNYGTFISWVREIEN